MEDWDPEFVALLARERRVIRFDGVGIGETGGITPRQRARHGRDRAGALLDALDIETVDLLGWSLGGYVAQTIALDWPTRVRRLVIAGSGPGGPDGPPPHPRVAEIAAKVAPTEEDVRFLFFTSSQIGQNAARRHFDHVQPGKRSPVATHSVSPDRGEAIVAWWKGEGSGKNAPLRTQHAKKYSVANGIADVMVPAEHSFAIARNAPNAKLILYPDAGHAFLFQYAHDYSAEVLKFLENI